MPNLPCLLSIPPNQVLLFETLLSVALSDEFNDLDLAAPGTTLTAIGSLLINKAALLASQQARKDDITRQILDLEKQIQKLKEQL